LVCREYRHCARSFKHVRGGAGCVRFVFSASWKSRLHQGFAAFLCVLCFRYFTPTDSPIRFVENLWKASSGGPKLGVSQASSSEFPGFPLDRVPTCVFACPCILQNPVAVVCIITIHSLQPFSCPPFSLCLVILI